MGMQQQNDDNKLYGTPVSNREHHDNSSRGYLCLIRDPGEHASGSDVSEIARGLGQQKKEHVIELGYFYLWNPYLK